jgi:TonB family protein
MSEVKGIWSNRIVVLASVLQLSFVMCALGQSNEPLKIGSAEGAKHLRTPPHVVYPNAPKLLSVQGDVELELTVSPKGDVIAERVVSGPQAFRQSALDAFKKAKYVPFLRDGKPTTALVAVRISYTTNQKIPPSDRAASDAFISAHQQCEDLKHRHTADALQVCQKALRLGQNLSQGTQLEARTVAYGDVVQLLIAANRISEASALGEDVMKLVEGTDPNTQAFVTAHLTRAQSRAAAGDLPGSDGDCTAAEESLRLLAGRETEPVFLKMFREELKHCLEFHSEVLRIQGNRQRAEELIAAAKRL